jgi:PhnB protein
MPTVLNPYIGFKDNARAAMEFYKMVFGGKLTISTFKEFQAPVEPDEENLVMHGMLVVDDGLTLMAADTPRHMEYKPGNNISISLSGDDESALQGYFAKLSEGGSVVQPLTKAPWGDAFGMLTDKFGIQWLVNISGKKA